MIAQFPAQKITAEIDKLNSTMPTADKDIFEMTISPVVNVCRKYRHGVRGENFLEYIILSLKMVFCKGMLKSQVQHLLQKYLEVEQHFQVSALFLLTLINGVQ